MSKFMITARQIKLILETYGFTYFKIGNKNIFDVPDNKVFYEVPKEFFTNDAYIIASGLHTTGALGMFGGNKQFFIDEKTTASLFSTKGIPRSTYDEINLVDPIPHYLSEDEKELIKVYIRSGSLDKIKKDLWNTELVYVLYNTGHDMEVIFKLLLKKNINLAHSLNIANPFIAQYLYKDMPDYIEFLKEIPENNINDAAKYISSASVAKDFIKLHPDVIEELDPAILDKELLKKVIDLKIYWYMYSIDYSILPKELLMYALDTSDNILEILYYLREDYPNYGDIVKSVLDNHPEYQNIDTITEYFTDKEIFVDLVNRYSSSPNFTKELK